MWFSLLPAVPPSLCPSWVGAFPNCTRSAHSHPYSTPGPRVLSAPPSSNTLAPWLSAVLLGVAVTAAALLCYFRPWRKNGPLPAQNPPPAPGEEQDALHFNVRYQNDGDEGTISSEVCVVQNNSLAFRVNF